MGRIVMSDTVSLDGVAQDPPVKGFTARGRIGMIADLQVWPCSRSMRQVERFRARQEIWSTPPLTGALRRQCGRPIIRSQPYRMERRIEQSCYRCAIRRQKP